MAAPPPGYPGAGGYAPQYQQEGQYQTGAYPGAYPPQSGSSPYGAHYPQQQPQYSMPMDKQAYAGQQYPPGQMPAQGYPQQMPAQGYPGQAQYPPGYPGAAGPPPQQGYYQAGPSPSPYQAPPPMGMSSSNNNPANAAAGPFACCFGVFACCAAFCAVNTCIELCC